MSETRSTSKSSAYEIGYALGLQKSAGSRGLKRTARLIRALLKKQGPGSAKAKAEGVRRHKDMLVRATTFRPRMPGFHRTNPQWRQAIQEAHSIYDEASRRKILSILTGKPRLGERWLDALARQSDVYSTPIRTPRGLELKRMLG